MHEAVRGRHPGRRILIADDDPIALEGLRSLLESWGYVVGTATDGQAALDQLPIVHPALVITDLVMPRMTGLELLESIRRNPPIIPVIIMTAHGTLENRRRAVASGAAAYLSKPVDIGHLKFLLESVLRDTRGNDQP
ncbi:MAG TPA: response regulator [Candidatus Bathyarchaeia archaeon]|nr:response regulator [Candidatus Bathyarchaeia archaeon]